MTHLITGFLYEFSGNKTCWVGLTVFTRLLMPPICSRRCFSTFLWNSLGNNIDVFVLAMQWQKPMKSYVLDERGSRIGWGWVQEDSVSSSITPLSCATNKQHSNTTQAEQNRYSWECLIRAVLKPHRWSRLETQMSIFKCLQTVGICHSHWWSIVLRAPRLGVWC